MKDDTQLQPSTQFCLALLGEPFCRKSSLAIQFPAPLFFDCDRKLATIVKYYPQCRPFYYVEPDLDDDGKELPAAAKWSNLIRLVNANAKDARAKTLVIDSMSRVSEYLCDHIIAQGGASKDLVVGGEKIMTQQMWYPYLLLMTKFIVGLRATQKPCIFTFHERTDKDEVSGMFLKQPKLGGQLRDDVTKLFTDVWRCKTALCPIDAMHPGGVKFMVRTEPEGMIAQLGHSMPMPPEFESKDLISLLKVNYPHLLAA